MGQITENRWFELLRGEGDPPTKHEQDAIDAWREHRRKELLRAQTKEIEKKAREKQLEQQRKTRNGRRNIRKILNKRGAK